MRGSRAATFGGFWDDLLATTPGSLTNADAGFTFDDGRVYNPDDGVSLFDLLRRNNAPGGTPPFVASNQSGFNWQGFISGVSQAVTNAFGGNAQANQFQQQQAAQAAAATTRTGGTSSLLVIGGLALAAVVAISLLKGNK